MPDVLGTEDAGGLARPRIGLAVWWFGLGATALVAASLTLIVYREGLPERFVAIPQLDKALHFGMAGSLAFFLDGVLRRRALRIGRRSVPLAAVLLLVPAAIEEFLQRYSVHRSSSLADFAADVAGVALFIWLSRRIGG
ncbi:MAG: VanZ family protein [Labilithrix sp.]|nr:VanZ family protein [Labilithrix sp.]